MRSAGGITKLRIERSVNYLLQKGAERRKIAADNLQWLRFLAGCKLIRALLNRQLPVLYFKNAAR